ncbi:MAG TPA: hypothetical protein VMF07_20420 [Solirubrobacteraceae bacterium]|nr:hypothetical protein [Solirubrobacteraceae bacterium]
MPTDNETLVRRFFEEFCNQRRSEVADELIAEEWSVWDALGLLQQVGAVPVPA